MLNPLFVPGRQENNPPTDDYWPHLDEHLHPILSPDEGELDGPYRAVRVMLHEEDEGGRPHLVDSIDRVMVAVTAHRILVVGPIGREGGPGARMIGQFRYDWCAEIGYHPSDQRKPGRLMIGGILREDGRDRRVRLVIGFPGSVDSAELAVGVVHRVGRRLLDAELVDPADRDRFVPLAEDAPDDAAAGFELVLPTCRPIELDADYSSTGETARADLIHTAGLAG